MLVAVAQRIAGCVRDSDVVARIGGDEFVVVLPTPGAQARAEEIARDITRAVTAPIDVDGTPWAVGASIGIASTSGHLSIEELLRTADTEMYRRKVTRG